MTDVAQLAIAIDSNQVKQGTEALNKMSEAGAKAETATKRLSSATQMLADAARVAVGAFAAYKLLDHIKESAMLAARYETMGVVMRVAGNNAGYTGAQMGILEKQLQKTGISMLQARNSLTQLSTANIDLSKATGLARAAQDLAVVANINSSDALGRLIHGIKSGEVEILRTMGLNVNFENSYKQLASTLHTTSDKLTENQKVQARVNATMKEAAGFTGIYEQAMGTAGKQILSMQRYIEDLKVKQGDVFNEVLTVGVMAFTAHLKDANGEVDELAKNGQLKEWGEGVTDAIVGAADVMNNFVLIVKTVSADVAYLVTSLGSVANHVKRSFGETDPRKILASWSTMTGELKRNKEQIQATEAEILAGTDRFSSALIARRAATASSLAKVGMQSASESERLSRQQEASVIAAGAATRAAAEADAKRAKAMDEAAKAAKKYDEAYQSVIKAVSEKTASEKLDAATQMELTDGQKYAVKVLDDLRTGELKLSAVKAAKLGMMLEEYLAEEKANKQRKAAYDQAMREAEARAAMRKSEEDGLNAYFQTQADGYHSAVQGSRDALKAAQDEYAQMGMSKAQIAQITLLKLESTRASFAEGSAGRTAAEQQIEAQKELIDVLQKTEARAGWQSIFESIDRTAHDTFLSIFDSGKSAFDRLRDTLKNGLLDLLYQMTVKKWLINIGASVTGQTGMAGAMGRSGGGLGSLLNMGQQGSSLMNAASAYSTGGLGGLADSYGLAGAYNTAAGWFGAVGSGLTGGAGAVGASTSLASLGLAGAEGAVALGGAGASATGGAALAATAGEAAGAAASTGAMAGISSALAAIPVWGWVAMAAMAVIGLNSGGETRGGGQYGYKFDGQALMNNRRGAAVAGASAGVNLLEGPSGGEIAGGQARQMVSSTVTGVNSMLKELGSTATLTGFQAGLESSEKGRGGVFAGGTLSTGASFGQSGQGDNYAGTLYDPAFSTSPDAQQALKDFATELKQTTLLALQAATDLPKSIAAQLQSVDVKKLSDEAATSLLTSISTEIAAVNSFRDAIERMPFENLKNLTFDAAENLIKLSGGVESFGQKLNSYYENYYTEAERTAQATANMKDALADLGFANVTTLAQFRALVSGLDMTVEADQKTYASLMNLQGAFAEVTKASQSVATVASVSARLFSASWTTAAKAAQSTGSAWSGVFSHMKDTMQEFKNFAKETRDYADSLFTGADSPLNNKQKIATLQERLALDTEVLGLGNGRETKARRQELAAMGITKESAMGEMQQITSQLLPLLQQSSRSSLQYAQGVGVTRGVLEMAAANAIERAIDARAQMKQVGQQLRGFSTGGDAGGAYMAGEAGPEMILSGPATVVNSTSTRQMMQDSADLALSVRDLITTLRDQGATQEVRDIAIIKGVNKTALIVDRWEANGVPIRAHADIPLPVDTTP